jgi:predicted membrane protein
MYVFVHLYVDWVVLRENTYKTYITYIRMCVYRLCLWTVCWVVLRGISPYNLQETLRIAYTTYITYINACRYNVGLQSE